MKKREMLHPFGSCLNRCMTTSPQPGAHHLGFVREQHQRPRRLSAILSCILLATLILVLPDAPPASADGTNLLSNPGCENGTTAYQGYQATISTVTTPVRSGVAACKATSTTGSFYSLTANDSYPNPQTSKTFAASAWVRAATATGANVYAALRERGGTAATRTVYGTAVQLTTQWQQVTGTLTVTGSGRTALDFYLVQDPSSAGQSFYADDMTFQATPSGQPIPAGDLPGWRQIATEDFTTPAPLGSWAASCATDPHAADKIVYTGATGTQWRTYPDCYSDTAGRPYRSDQVLSVHDGVLDFALHNVNGLPAGANPSPIVNAMTGSQYQTYGRYTARFRVDTATLAEYHIAWLLWPTSDSDWKCAESDFPEADLDSNTADVHAHYGCTGAQDSFSAAIDFTQWHTFTQEWAPGIRRYYLDGTLIKTSTHSVFSSPERYQLQTETTGSGTHSGHLLVDWVAIYAYQN